MENSKNFPPATNKVSDYCIIYISQELMWKPFFNLNCKTNIDFMDTSPIPCFSLEDITLCFVE